MSSGTSFLQHPRYDRVFSRSTTTSDTGLFHCPRLCISSVVFVTATAILLTHLTHDFFAGELCERSRCAVTVYVILKGYRSVYRELLGKLIPKLWVKLRFVIAVLRCKRSLEKTCLLPAVANGACLDVPP
ncbi:hypothetical protein HPB50_026190 [Hyalomma asiaticum]|uniref:Uncharacterized protein n=1 Tax=Hyalomma asiaticum TaxID=266040 RepID=A0ACB7TNX5_HYAAI|nr:hypothetical protein HPB50_026190 [Hyalomma asiaticum]